MTQVQTGVIQTQVPARLDRLPWSRFHWMVVIGLGTAWILDGLEVTMVGTVAARMTEPGSGIAINAAQIGLAGGIYVIGACTGALFFGQLTDRFGRKKLFMITLAIYLAATGATALAFAPWYFFIARFVTGFGIGGEYAAINSAIDELIPARVRGRVDLIINGSYWLGAAGGALLAIVLLNTALLPLNVGWRLGFAAGVALGPVVLLVRRHVPESPRWLFIHGREDEAERLVDGIEQDVAAQTDTGLSEPDTSITVRQRRTISFREIARTAFQLYPRRTVLGLALFVGQAFLYNAVTFDLGTLMTSFFDVTSGGVPYFIAIYAVASFIGPLVLGRWFDTVGRKPMVSLSYLGAAAMLALIAWLFGSGVLNAWTFIGLVALLFFLASSGASSAYLTVSEIFPMETRALAIAFFYAVGTATGGIVGPWLFGGLIGTGDAGLVAVGFYIGAAVMAVGGLVEIVYGVPAEQASLEDIAKPLTAAEAEEPQEPARPQEPAAELDLRPERQAARLAREQAEQRRAQAAEHRTAAHQHEARTAEGHDRAGQDAEVERQLAQIADVRARALDERAAANDERAAASHHGERGDEASRRAAQRRAEAADQRAQAQDESAAALGAGEEGEAQRHRLLAESAAEQARAGEQRALAEEARPEPATEGMDADVSAARAAMHERWAEMHTERARARAHEADRDTDGASSYDSRAQAAEERALAAEEQVAAARHRDAVEQLSGEAATAEQASRERREVAEAERRATARAEDVRARIERRQARERSGLRRFRPGPGRTSFSPGMPVAEPVRAEEEIEHEVDVIARALNEHGPVERAELARLVGARYWGPGRFRVALREAVRQGYAQRLSRNTVGPPRGE